MNPLQARNHKKDKKSFDISAVLKDSNAHL